MRTQEEILKKIIEVKDRDLFGVVGRDLVGSLNYKNAKVFLNDTVTKGQWNKKINATDEDVIKEMKGYLDFAYRKAEDQRGLSAARSMDHYYAWIWLIVEEENFGDIREYSDYGIPHLDKIKEFLEDK